MSEWLKSTISVVIGAVIAVLVSVIGEKYKYYLENKREQRNQLKQIYESIQTSLFIQVTQGNIHDNGEFIKFMNSLGGKVILYCNKDIVNKWNDLSLLIMSSKNSDDFQSKISNKGHELLTMMKHDLGINN